MELVTEQLSLIRRTPEHAREIAAYYARNSVHLAPWEPKRPPGFHSAENWAKRLEAEQQDPASGPFLPLLICAIENSKILGLVNLSNEVRGVFQACHLGFSIDADCQGNSIAFEALEAVIAYTFGTLNLHRIMANHLPENTRSARLLKRLGFEEEGYAREYLMINGQWRDHILTSKINPDWAPLPT